MFRFTFFIIAFFMMSQTYAVAAITCDPQPMGKINVTWGSENISYDFTKSQSYMDRMDNDTINPYDKNIQTHVGGLMKGGISVQSRVQVATLTYPRSRQVCQWIDSMTIGIRIDPKIYIARVHKQGTCKHKTILEHEMKHVFVDREIVKKYIPIFTSELNKALRKVGIVGPKAQNDTRKYQGKINDYMEQKLKAITDKMYAERSDRQMNVDTLQEYERVAGLCR